MPVSMPSTSPPQTSSPPTSRSASPPENPMTRSMSTTTGLTSTPPIATSRSPFAPQSPQHRRERVMEDHPPLAQAPRTTTSLAGDKNMRRWSRGWWFRYDPPSMKVVAMVGPLATHPNKEVDGMSDFIQPESSRPMLSRLKTQVLI